MNLHFTLKKYKLFYWPLALLISLATAYSPYRAQATATSKSILETENSNQRLISGKVVDPEGKPLLGVTINIKGGSIATRTDSKGEFTIQIAHKDDILIISYLGFQTREVIPVNAAFVTLTPFSDIIEELVVVGYGTQKKTNLTSAVSQVDTKLLEDRPAPSIVNMLQGASPGLVITRNSGKPGSQGFNLQVRGATSANGPVPPLIIIDGVISSEETFTALNPTDIAGISILKDGGATAIYGAESAGGVLLVSTKQGAPGRSRISLSSNLGWQRPGNIPKRLSLIDEMTYVNLARANAGLSAEYSEEDLEYAVNGPTFVLGSNGQWRTYNQESLIDQVIKERYKIFNNNLQFSGGNEKVTYLASLGNMTQNGMFKVGDDRYGRTNARLNLSARVTDFFKIDYGSTYIHQSTDHPQDGGYGIDGGGNSILRQFFSSRMRFPIFNEDGSYYRSGSSSAFGYALLKDGGFNRDRLGTYFNNLTATIDNLVQGLKIRAMYSREDTRKESKNFRRTVTYYSGPTANTASYLNNPNNYVITNQHSLRQNYQAIADYSLTIANSHHFQLMAGYQLYDYQRNYITASTRDLYVNESPSLNFTSDPNNKSNNQYAEGEKMQSYFGRFNYNYLEKYLFEATVRGDESSRLSPENRMKVFPSFSMGWNLHKESLFKDLSTYVNEFKPRLSWGKVGSKLGSIWGIGYYDYIAQLPSKSNLLLADNRQTYLYQDMIAATGLSWETIETMNYGLDLSFLNKKLKGSFDYYTKYNNNMLVTINLPATIGIKTPKSNGGKLKTWGWEAALAYADKFGNELNYSIAFNLADNHNRLIRYSGANNIITPGVNHMVEGYALNSIWAYKTNGYFQSEEELKDAPSYAKLLNKSGVPGLGDIRYVDINGDKEISAGKNTVEDPGDLLYRGDTNPRYQYGLSIQLSYKNFDFSLFAQGIAKRKFKPSNELIQPQLYPWYLPMSFHTDYWTPENRNASYPRPYLQGNHNFQPSDKWFLNGAYARLKNVQFGYTLTKAKLKALPFSRARAFLSGEDLLTISKLGIHKGVIDPEMRPEDKKISPYPFTTTISFGLNIEF